MVEQPEEVKMGLLEEAVATWVASRKMVVCTWKFVLGFPDIDVEIRGVVIVGSVR